MLSPADRAALAMSGIEHVEQREGTFVLEDRDDQSIGDVELANGTTIDATLVDNHVRSSVRADAVAVECNGTSVSIPRGGSSTIDTTAIAPCNDVLRVASILLAPDASRRTPAGATPLLAQADCSTYLGSNTYCDGTTQVINYDTMCTNGGDSSWAWVQTWTLILADSSYCS